MSPDRAAEAVLQRLKEGGPTAFDITREADRSHAVDATIRAGLDLLPAAAADRFLELGIFAADRPIDLNALMPLGCTDGMASMSSLRGFSGVNATPSPTVAAPSTVMISRSRQRGRGAGAEVAVTAVVRTDEPIWPCPNGSNAHAIGTAAPMSRVARSSGRRLGGILPTGTHELAQMFDNISVRGAGG
jgi:hypothetical protein